MPELYSSSRYAMNLLSDLNDTFFKNFTGMSREDFVILLEMISPQIKQNTFFREAIPPEVRLAVTLRFLASGDSYTSLQYTFKISRQVISRIIPEVCTAICEVLKDFVKVRSKTIYVFLVICKFINKPNSSARNQYKEKEKICRYRYMQYHRITSAFTVSTVSVCCEFCC